MSGCEVLVRMKSKIARLTEKTEDFSGDILLTLYGFFFVLRALHADASSVSQQPPSLPPQIFLTLFRLYIKISIHPVVYCNIYQR